MAEDRLQSRGLIRDGALTDAGLTAREAIEVVTDEGCAPITTALGRGLDELVSLIGAWSRQLQAAGGYPPAEPQGLAAQTNR
ncbi:hypothetical protein A5707_02665 [Mycobacterium kyorinense]|uniref:Uncharacterized protein n=1 Tax=Mycobacterium kyorinense TaxID=487514 RepID=A0A1A2Z2L6_9MYCO|nr:hypothetical protein [Mycobacterium kyorinense]OBI44729.1 hypothetical protein A5707_02665 [Mycobacterium kyorinense]